MKTSVLRPGLLVSLKTSIKGGVEYQRQEIEAEHQTAEGGTFARWETARLIPDPKEFEAATQARSKCRSLVSAVCSASSFGLLCPADNEQQLTDALEEARKVADAHNATAQLAFVEVFVLVGRVARDDEEAARAIASEVRELIDAMKAGIMDANPEAIREAANKARSLGAMLSDDVAGKVGEAIDQARKAARAIVKRVEKAGEAASDVVKELVSDKLDSARFAFLDIGEAGHVTQEAPTARQVEMMDEVQDETPPAPVAPRSAPLPFALEVN